MPLTQKYDLYKQKSQELLHQSYEFPDKALRLATQGSATGARTLKSAPKWLGEGAKGLLGQGRDKTLELSCRYS